MSGARGSRAAGLVDTHCHLEHIHGSRADVLTAAAKVGVDAVVDVGMGTEGSARVVERAAGTPNVFAAVGLHPNDLGEFREDRDAAMQRLAALAAHPVVVAVGETGLDAYRQREPAPVQEAAFAAQIALAKAVGKTLVIHCRDAHERVAAVLDAEGPPERVVMHCFSGDVTFAGLCDERGWYVSFAGNLTYKKNDELRAAAAAVREALLLVETDAPYLTPHPFRGRENSPAFLPLTVAALAEARGVDEEDLAVTLRRNAGTAFSLPVGNKRS